MSIATLTSVKNEVLDSFPFTIDKFPLTGPDGLCTPHYGLFRSDNAECLDVSVKKGYVPHTRDDIAALAEAAIKGFGSEYDATVKCKWIPKRGHRVIIEPSRDYRRTVFGSDDNIFPRAIIRADYGRAFRADFGMFRDTCSNLMMIRGVKATSFSIRHTNSLRDKMDELISGFEGLAASADNVYEIALKLEAERASVKEFLSTLYPGDSKHDIRRAQKMLTRLMQEKRETGRALVVEEASLWELVNCVTGYVEHDKTRRGKPDSTTRALLALDDKESEEAWKLALSMAG